MLRPDKKTLEAILNLRGDSNFEEFIGWINNSYATELRNLVGIGTEPQKSWAQGQLQQLEMIFDTVEKARDMLDQLEQGGS